MNTTPTTTCRRHSTRLSFPPTLWVLFLAVFVAVSATAQIPDLTAGNPVPASPTPLYINLGPTGLEGWMYRVGSQTTDSRQILVTSVAAGSPAAGVFAINDVILGANGTGATATIFTSDARKSLAYAIADAEARNPATLSLLRWRAGATTEVTLTLQTLGAYSATAPYSCPKSAAILEMGLNHDVAEASPDNYAFIALSMMAADDPDNPKNAERQTLARTEVRKLILPQAEIDAAMAGVVPTSTKVAWHIGHELIVLGEYYRKTKDAMVYDSLRARAHQAANGSSLFGTHGHQFTVPDANGKLNGSYNHGYGVMNNASLTCFLGLVLAREAGISDPVVEAAIQRAAAYYGSHANKGAINYGEHYPVNNTTDNGKCGQVAMCMRAIAGRETERDYFARYAISSHKQRDSGHQGSWFNYIWSPLGAAAAGEQAASAYFREISWMLDLNRRWDGSFEYNQLHTSGGQGGDSYQSPKMLMSTVALLTYALPRRQLFITGDDRDDPVGAITAADAADAAFASGYSGTGRTTTELFAHLGHIHFFVRNLAASELGRKTAEYATTLPALVAMANNVNGGNARYGATYALGKLTDGSGAPALVPLLTNPDPMVRYNAARAFGELDKAIVKLYKNELMVALAANSQPFFPLDPQDPFRFGDTFLAEAIFTKALVDGIGGVERNLLYPAIEAAINLNNAMAWSAISKIYKHLSKADLEAVAGGVLETMTRNPAGNAVSNEGISQQGMLLLGRHDVAEGVPLSIPVFYNSGDSVRSTIINELEDYAGGSLTVKPDPQIVDFLNLVVQQYGSQQADAQAALAAIYADPNAAPLVPFKGITSVTVNPPVLTLPRNWTRINVSSYDHAKGDSIYTWRKVQGLGNVTFGTNGTAEARDTTVMFDGTPGIYTLEVTMSDSRGLTEVSEQVVVTLLDSGGTLPANSPPTASPVSMSAAHGIPVPIHLRGSDPEGHPLVYRVASNPLGGTIEGSGANLVYTPNYSFTGVDTFSYQVTDSDGQQASATVSITVSAAANVGLAVYEPFDYPAGSLNGASGTSEIGFSGAWTAHSSMDVAAGSLGFSSLVTKGNAINEAVETVKSFGGKRGISTAALADAGLLDDGATLWMSASMGLGANGWTNILSLALANNQFSNTGGHYAILNDGADLGRGVGVHFRQWRPVAALFRDPSTGSNQSPIIVGTQEANNAKNNDGQYQFLVAKFTWGATSDTIELYQVLPDMSLGAPCSYLTVNVDQSKFDTLTFTRQYDIDLDEIRLGSTYQSVLQGTVPMTPDTTAPSPNPMSFEIPAHTSSPDSIRMVAANAFDLTGVEYYFTCTAGGGHDSGWQDSPIYIDSGLTPGVLYSYTVKTRDKSAAQNETAASAATSAMIPAKTLVPFVAGVPQAAAEQAILESYLSLDTVTTGYNPSFPIPGTVISVTPAAGSAAAYGTSVDLLVSLGWPSITPAEFVDDRGGASIHINYPVTYNLTFIVDIDAGTVNAADFSNAGTSAITVGAINEISPGVFTVAVTPTTEGTLKLRIHAGASIADPTGNQLDTSSAIADDTTITITPPNVPPAWNADPFSETPVTADRDYASSLANNATDANGDTLTFAKVGGPAWLSVASDGTLSGTPGGGDVGVNRFTVSVSDGYVTDVEATMEIAVVQPPEGVVVAAAAWHQGDKTVTPAELNNFNPVGTDKLVVTAHGEQGDLGFSAVTYAGQPLTPAVGTNNDWNFAQIWYLDHPAAQGNLVFTGDETKLAVSVMALNGTVEGVAVTKKANATSISFDSGSDGAFVLAAFSENGDGTATANPPLNPVISGSTALGGGAKAGSGWVITDAGSKSYSFTATNSRPTLCIASFAAANTPPTWTSDLIVKVDATEDTAYTGALVDNATDADGDPLTFAKVSGPAWLSVATDGSLSGTPADSDIGLNAFSVSVTDGNNPAVEISLQIPVNNANDAPVFASDPFQAVDAPEDEVYAGTISGAASDSDGDALTYALVSGPAWLTVAQNGALSGTPENSDVGFNIFTVTASDGIAPPVEATLTIAVLNTNDAPRFSSDPLSAAVATINVVYASTIASSATDDDGDALTFAKVSGATWLTVAADGTLSGNPSNNDGGLNQFIVSVTDGNSAAVEVTINIQVGGGFPSWVAANIPSGSDATFGGDWNADGTSNGIEYIFGSGGMQQFGRGVLSAPPMPIPSDVNLRYETTIDLHNWSRILEYQGGVPIFTATGVTISDGQVIHEIGSDTVRFYRCSASLHP